MDDQKTTQLLHLQFAEIPGRTPFCMEDQQIAEYYEGVLPETDRERVEHHVSDCRFCAARIGILARLDQEAAESRVLEDTLAAAKLSGQPSRHTHRRLPAWAAAAAVLLAVGIYLQSFSGRLSDPGMESPIGSPVQSGNLRETRTFESPARGPSILSPREGQNTRPNSLITWTTVPHSLYYRVRVVADDGDLVWQERVEGTEWRLPAGLGLEPETEFYVRIDAYLTETKSLQSEYVLFRFRGKG